MTVDAGDHDALRSARPSTPARAAGAALAVLAVAQVLLAQVLDARGSGTTSWAANELNSSLVAVGFAAAGSLVTWHGPRNVLGWLLLAVANLQSVTVLGEQWLSQELAQGPPGPLVLIAVWITANAWWLGFLLLVGPVPLLFPTGRLPSPRWRPVAALAAVAGGVAVLLGVGSGALVVDSFPQVPHSAPLGGLPEAILTGVVVTGLLTVVACGTAALVARLIGLRTCGGAQRRRMAWPLLAYLGLVLLPLVLPFWWVAPVVYLAFPLALGVAVVRYGLFDGDRLVSRALVHAVLSAAVLTALGLGAAAIGGGLAGAPVQTALAAVVIALGIAPLHRLTQRVVDRLVYGDGSDRQQVLRSLGAHLTRLPDDEEPLGSMAQLLARSLRVPRVEVDLDGSGAGEPGSASPGASPRVLSVPLQWGGEHLGHLRIHLPPRRRRLDPVDEHLLADLLPLITVAVRTSGLLGQAQRARQDLVRAVEEERRRLHRDLHDGIGPSLAGISLGLSAAAGGARRGRAPDPVALERLDAQVLTCLGDVKNLVSGLRPAVLDGLGLPGALREHAETLTASSGTRFVVHAELPTSGREVPAAVELAAYRAAMEAMTNVATHAAATTCDVEVRVRAGAMELTVCDDGVGLHGSCPEPVAAGAAGTGTGLASIAERARELGGTSTVASDHAGTRVHLRLPLAEPDPAGVPG
ncbi:signal transduction histidine kinase [Kineococcus xinjiangensis]|uniref:Oxygen sensor histidine kinase NreB n=1 Tax=Kineococcus xinjiangensis TaxID=512762 RepID=A0A2S6ID91_9ACTN|nr:histidine kinase [Kineococcus xinjiangensis]PPK92188.1 signal transduction histidine kinase [Kineococcus xinjiangensis]